MVITIDMIRNMRTVNRKPGKTWWTPGSTKIAWKCHGINQHGKRIKWEETTYTVVTMIFNPMFDKYEKRYNTTRYAGWLGVAV